MTAKKTKTTKIRHNPLSRLTKDEYLRKSQLRGTSRSSSKAKAVEAKHKASTGIVHYQPVRCTGRPNASDIARRRQRKIWGKARKS